MKSSTVFQNRMRYARPLSGWTPFCGGQGRSTAATGSLTPAASYFSCAKYIFLPPERPVWRVAAPDSTCIIPTKTTQLAITSTHQRSLLCYCVLYEGRRNRVVP